MEAKSSGVLVNSKGCWVMAAYFAVYHLSVLYLFLRNFWFLGWRDGSMMESMLKLLQRTQSQYPAPTYMIITVLNLSSWASDDLSDLPGTRKPCRAYTNVGKMLRQIKEISNKTECRFWSSSSEVRLRPFISQRLQADTTEHTSSNCQQGLYFLVKPDSIDTITTGLR